MVVVVAAAIVARAVALVVQRVKMIVVTVTEAVEMAVLEMAAAAAVLVGRARRHLADYGVAGQPETSQQHLVRLEQVLVRLRARHVPRAA